MKANHELLTLAREMRGMTQTDLAEELGYSQGYISKLEAGVIDIPDDRLPAIASVLNFPVEFFYQSDRIYGFGSPCLYHRKRVTIPMGVVRQINAEANVARLAVANLLRTVEIDAELSVPRLDIEDYGPADRIARMVRRGWLLPAGPIKNLVRVIEAAGSVVLRFNMPTRKIDAISIWAPEQVPLFLLNAESPMDRLRFSLAHELGHMVMHTLPSNDQEREADLFAAEFLMPAADIEPDLENVTLPRLAALKSYWRVSMAALVRRARDLSTITDRQYRRHNMTLRQRYGIREPNELSLEEPTVVRDVLDMHAEQWSVPELASLMKIGVPDFYNTFGPRRHLRVLEAP